MKLCSFPVDRHQDYRSWLLVAGPDLISLTQDNGLNEIEYRWVDDGTFEISQQELKSIGLRLFFGFLDTVYYFDNEATECCSDRYEIIGRPKDLGLYFYADVITRSPCDGGYCDGTIWFTRHWDPLRRLALVERKEDPLEVSIALLNVISKCSAVTNMTRTVRSPWEWPFHHKIKTVRSMKRAGQHCKRTHNRSLLSNMSDLDVDDRVQIGASTKKWDLL